MRSGLLEVAVRVVAAQAAGGGRADEGSPARGEGRAGVAGRGGPSRQAACGSRRRVGPVRRPVPAPGGCPVAQGGARGGGAGGRDSPAAQGSVEGARRHGRAAPAAGRDRPALRRDEQASRPARPGPVAVGRRWAAAACVAAVRGGEGPVEGPTASPGRVGAGAVAGGGGRGSAQGPGPVASAQGCARQAGEGERAAAAGVAGVAAADRDAGGGACEAAGDAGGAVEGVARPQERAAGEAGHRPLSRPAAWRSRPRPHAALRPGGAHRGADSAGRCAHLFRLREALRGGRRGAVGPGRDRGPGLSAGDPPAALAPDLRVRLVAVGGLGAAGVAAVRQHGLRHQRLVAGAV